MATLTSVEPAVVPDRSDALAGQLGPWAGHRRCWTTRCRLTLGFPGMVDVVLGSRRPAGAASFGHDDAARPQHPWRSTNGRRCSSSTAQLRTLPCPKTFLPGGVVEDPASGAAAAALGGYLRALGLVPHAPRVTIRQGKDMGRPSPPLVDIPSRAASRSPLGHFGPEEEISGLVVDRLRQPSLRDFAPALGILARVTASVDSAGSCQRMLGTGTAPGAAR